MLVCPQAVCPLILLSSKTAPAFLLPTSRMGCAWCCWAGGAGEAGEGQHAPTRCQHSPTPAACIQPQATDCDPFLNKYSRSSESHPSPACPHQVPGVRRTSLQPLSQKPLPTLRPRSHSALQPLGAGASRHFEWKSG